MALKTCEICGDEYTGRAKTCGDECHRERARRYHQKYDAALNARPDVKERKRVSNAEYKITYFATPGKKELSRRSCAEYRAKKKATSLDRSDQ